jgi:hypothetical protein
MTICLVYSFWISSLCAFLFKLAILICKCFWRICYFTIFLWQLNKIQYVENKMWWKNEPPYLATTPHVIFVDCHCVVPSCDTIFTTNWCATWGLKLDSKDVQGRVGLKIEANMIQSLPMETPNISFSNMWNILLNTFCCLHVHVIYFHSFVCFVSRSMVFENQFSIVLF